MAFKIVTALALRENATLANNICMVSHFYKDLIAIALSFIAHNHPAFHYQHFSDKETEILLDEATF